VKSLFISIKKSAETLGVSRSTICRLLDNGQLLSIKLGTRRLVDANSVGQVAREGRTKAKQAKIHKVKTC